MESQPGGSLSSNSWKLSQGFDQVIDGLGMERHNLLSKNNAKCQSSNFKLNPKLKHKNS
jgi:hypothetical protein